MGEGSRDFSGDKSWSRDDIELARKAAVGNEAAREAVSRLAYPLIHQQTKTLCKGTGFRVRHGMTTLSTSDEVGRRRLLNEGD